MIDAPNYQYPSGVTYSTADFGTVALTVDGNGEYAPGRLPPPPKFALISANVAGNTEVVAAVPGKKIRVLGYLVSTQTANSAVNIQFRDGATTVLAEFLDLDGQVAPSYAGSVVAPAFETSAGNPLNIHLQANKLVRGHLTYVEVD